MHKMLLPRLIFYSHDLIDMGIGIFSIVFQGGTMIIASAFNFAPPVRYADHITSISMDISLYMPKLTRQNLAYCEYLHESVVQKGVVAHSDTEVKPGNRSGGRIKYHNVKCFVTTRSFALVAQSMNIFLGLAPPQD